jgi:hypothetical protein
MGLNIDRVSEIEEPIIVRLALTFALVLRLA